MNIVITTFSGCSNGDVKLKPNGMAMIYHQNSWVPICGHYFWNNHIGANKFCQKIGFDSGRVSGKDEAKSYSVDAFKIGQCNEDDVGLQCSGGCNDNNVGAVCTEDTNLGCSAGEPVRIRIFCEGNSNKTSSCKGISSFYY